MDDKCVAVIIPAAGRGERCSGPSPKQYYMVMRKPLFIYAVEAFLNIPCVKKICLLSDNVELAQQHIDAMNMSPANRSNVILRKGGPSRHESIKIGLASLKNLDTYFDVAVIHDGARPIVPEKHLTELVRAAAAHGAAGSTRPLTSTVLLTTSEGHLGKSLDRSAHVASETPQAFNFEMIYEAYQKCSAKDLESGTECLDLALRYCGVSARLIPGPESLWKVTEKKDCYAAAAVLKAMSTKVCLISDRQNEVLKMLLESLPEQVASVDVVLTHEEKCNVKANTLVCFHDRRIDQEEQLALLADILDVDVPGVIVHVVMEAEDQVSGHVYDLLRSGRAMMTQYEKLKKGVVIIELTSPGEEMRLVKLVTTIILSDPSTFSGQTLFL